MNSKGLSLNRILLIASLMQLDGNSWACTSLPKAEQDKWHLGRQRKSDTSALPAPNSKIQGASMTKKEKKMAIL